MAKTSEELQFAADRVAKAVEVACADIERLTERCAAYKSQVECGAIEIERLRAVLVDVERKIKLYGMNGRDRDEETTNEIADYITATLGIDEQ